MQENQKKRNDEIRLQIRKLVGEGLRVYEAMEIVADRWFLSVQTVRAVLYDKRRK